MKLAWLGLLLMSGGCSLYFGDSSQPPPPWPEPWPGPVPPDAQNAPPPWYPDAPAYPPPPGPDASVPDPGCDGTRVEVIGMYEPGHGANQPPGGAQVSIERPGTYRLVLSAYDAVKWHVSLAAGAKLESVALYGYYDQSVDVVGVPITSHSYAAGNYACGYSFPYNGQGCDTVDLLTRVQAESGPVHGFHGCYRASEWTLHADDSVTSNCDTAAGYKQDDFVTEVGATCAPPSSGWKHKDFETFDPATCTGQRFISHNATYDAWIGAIQCGDADHYKLYMSRRRNGTYLEIADFAGHGEDHCELVNANFTLPDEDDITSGGCTSCSVGDLVDLIGKPVFARAMFGEPFKRVQSRFWADLTTNVYSCGVSIP